MSEAKSMIHIVEKVIKNLEPLLDAKNQSWAQAEKMLIDILGGKVSVEPVAKDDADIYAFWARNKEAERKE